VSAKNAVTLGDLVGRFDRLEVRCRQCQRHGRLGLARFVADHGAGTGLPDLAARLAADCPRAKASTPGEGCFVHCPQLLAAVRLNG
jgi:hypothetical protein